MSHKDDMDNHSNQLNPEHDAYWQSRGNGGKPDYDDNDMIVKLPFKPLYLLCKEDIKKSDTKTVNPVPKPETIDLVNDITDADFEQAIKSHRVVLVDCWSPSCRSCKKMFCIIDGLSKHYAEWAAFYELNVDTNPNVVAQFGIHSVPTILIFANGKLSVTFIGVVNRQEVECKLFDVIEKNKILF